MFDPRASVVLEALDRIRTVRLALVLERQVRVRHDVLGRSFQEPGGLGKPDTQALADVPRCVMAVA